MDGARSVSVLRGGSLGTGRSLVRVSTVLGTLNRVGTRGSGVNHRSAWSLVRVRGSARSGLGVGARSAWSLESVVRRITVRHVRVRSLTPGRSRDGNECGDGVLVQHDFVVDFTISHEIIMALFNFIFFRSITTVNGQYNFLVRSVN